jgi:hypothetical protein
MGKADWRVLPVGSRWNPCSHRDGIIKKKIIPEKNNLKKKRIFFNNF